MTTHESPSFVPKVHPLSRMLEPEDPLELMATPAPGDPDVMVESIVQEFVWMGWSAEQLLEIFQNPMYPVLNQLREHLGDEVIRDKVQTIVERAGIFSFHETIADEPDSIADDEPELLELSTCRLEKSHGSVAPNETR
jgi:hypothetical protein